VTSGANPYQLKTCNDCGDRYMNWGAHAEECPGPRVQAAEQACDCPPGWKHEPGCPIAHTPLDAA
jgi:hypothetical protein